MREGGPVRSIRLCKVLPEGYLSLKKRIKNAVIGPQNDHNLGKKIVKQINLSAQMFKAMEGGKSEENTHKHMKRSKIFLHQER